MKAYNAQKMKYRLEDEGLIEAKWRQGQGRTAPKKIYEATKTGYQENLRRQMLWADFQRTGEIFLKGEKTDE